MKLEGKLDSLGGFFFNNKKKEKKKKDYRMDEINGRMDGWINTEHYA